MSDDSDRVSIEGCTVPGTIKVTPTALACAESFQTAVPSGYIVVFSWHDGEKVRANKDAPWVDKGPGLGIGAFRTDEIPKEAIYHAGSFRYAVLIRKEIVDNHPQKTIDLDENGNPILT